MTGSSLGASLNNVEALEDQMLLDLEDDIVFHSLALELAELKKEKLLLTRANRERCEEASSAVSGRDAGLITIKNSDEVSRTEVEATELIDVKQEQLAETEVNLGSPAVKRAWIEVDVNAEKNVNVTEREAVTMDLEVEKNMTSDSEASELDSDDSDFFTEHRNRKKFSKKSLESSECKKRNVQQHMNTHNGKKKNFKSKVSIECPHCGRQCASKKNLEIHLFTHTGEKPFACDACEMKFALKCTLIKHKRTHDGSKPYACDLCDQTFSRNDYLMKHKRTHSGIKPYSCDICKKKYTRKENLTKHERKHG